MIGDDETIEGPRPEEPARPWTHGVLLGAAAMLPLCALEVIWLLRDGSVSAGDAASFALFDLGLLLLAGGVVGGFEGAMAWLIHAAAQRIARRREHVAALQALLWALAALPAVAWVAARMFEGRQARALPGRHLWAAGAGVVALVGIAAGVRLVIFLRPRAPRLGDAARAVALAFLWLIAGVLLRADREWMARLYPAMHVTLAIGAFVFAQAGIAVVAAGRTPMARAPLLAMGVLAAGLCATATGLDAGRLRAAVVDGAPMAGKVLALLPSGETEERAPAPPAVAAPALLGPRLPARDLVLITVDALRADRLAAWGNRRGLTPNLDRLASASTVFTQAYCPAPHTSFSIATILTGQYAHTRAALGLPARVDTLPEVLRRFGYKTAAFFPPAVFFIDRERFREYEDGRYGFEYIKYEYLDAPGRTSQILSFLELAKAAPRTFIWAHYFEPHEPYVRQPDFDFGPSAEDRYDGEVAATDREIGRLLEALDRVRPGAIVAVTADHGEEFGEHGGHYHGTSLYDEQARVPLIVRVPGVPPRRIEAPVGTVDLAPTLLSLVDVPPLSSMSGSDLGPWIGGADPAALPAAFAEVLSRRMAARGHHKLIVDFSARVSELYDLRADPGEKRNLIDDQPSRAAELRADIDRRLAQIAGLDEGNVRRAALERARAGDPSALPEVLARLATGDLESRREAAELLFGVVGEPARAAIEAGLDEADPEVAHRVALAGARLGIQRAVERTRRLLNRPDLPERMRRQAALALAEQRIADGLEVLTAMLSTGENFEERQAAARVLGSLRDPRAVPALIRVLTDVRMRRFAVAALGEIGDRRAVDPLLGLLERDRFISVREAAARAILHLGDPRAAARLRARLAVETERPVIAELLAALARLKALPGGTGGDGEQWLVLYAERAASASITVDGANLAVVEARAGYGAYQMAGLRPAASLTVVGADLVGVWSR